MALLELGESQFWRQPNATAPARFQSALGALIAVQTPALAFYCVLALVSAYSVREWRWRLRRGRSRNRTSARVAWWIFMHVACCLLTQVSNAIMLRSAFATRDDVLRCHWLHRISAAGYISSLGAQYMVLLVRAELTLDESNRWSRLSFKLTKLMTIAGVPSMAVLALISFHGTVFYAETCTQSLVLWLVWLFLVSSTGLSACFLLMFIVPVYRYAQESVAASGNENNRAASHRLTRTARKNLRLSLVQIVSTLLFQLAGAVAQTAFRDDQGQPENSYLRIVNFTGYICDLLINTSMLLLMSSAWQPQALHNLLRCRRRAGVQPSALTPHKNPAEAYIVGAPTAGQVSTMITQGGQSIMSSAGSEL